MPVREIKTTLSLDGEKQFKQELADASRQMRVMNADLKAMAAEFENTDDAQRYYTQRSETLNNKVAQQKEIVRALTDAMKRSVDVYGDAAKETDGYRIKLSNATEQLFRMEKEAEEAARELEDLGRDSNRIGRQIETGIGDAAEDVSEKLDGMFDKVASDISALKGSVAWQTTMNVGEFVLDGIQSVMGFVQENQELNMKLAQTRSVIEMYGYDAEEMLRIAEEAAAVTGDLDGALEAITNLSAAGFDTEEQIRAVVNNLLGVWLSSGGALDFGGLAEDYLESVKEKTPTGTYAEAIIKFTDRSVEDVQKILESMTTHADTLEAATAVLTEAGLQTKAENFRKENAEMVELQALMNDTTLKTASIAEQLTPIVTDVLGLWNTLLENADTAAGDLVDLYNKIKNKLTGANGEKEPLTVPEVERKSDELMWGWLVDLLIPSAGAAELPPEYGEYGAQAFSAFETGMQTAAEESTAGADAANALVSDMESANGNAHTAGKNAMIYYANGIADGAPYVYRNLQTVMDSINSILNSAAVPSWGGGVPSTSGGANPNTTVSERGTAVLQIDGQTAGRLLYSGVSSAGARKVQTKMIVR